MRAMGREREPRHGSPVVVLWVILAVIDVVIYVVVHFSNWAGVNGGWLYATLGLGALPAAFVVVLVRSRKRPPGVVVAYVLLIVLAALPFGHTLYETADASPGRLAAALTDVKVPSDLRLKNETSRLAERDLFFEWPSSQTWTYFERAYITKVQPRDIIWKVRDAFVEAGWEPYGGLHGASSRHTPPLPPDSLHRVSVRKPGFIVGITAQNRVVEGRRCFPIPGVRRCSDMERGSREPLPLPQYSYKVWITVSESES